MVDVVGLRFVTEGQKEALASLDLYERGIRSLSNVQDRAVAEMNRSRRADMQAFALNQRLKQQALRQEEQQQAATARVVLQANAEQQRAQREQFQAFALSQRLKQRYLQDEARQQAATARAAQQSASEQQRAVARRDAEERRVLQNYLRYQRERESAARAEAAAAQQAAAQAARAVAQRDVEDRRAFQQYLRLQNERERVARETARAEEQAAQQAARAQQQAVQAYNQLRAATDPVFAAQQRVALAETTVQQALARGIITREEAARTMAQYRAQVQMTTQALQANQVAHQFASRGMNGAGMAMQQVGYQVGDFLVQIQSGTNAFVAFGQQATQLVGILPLMGAGFMGLSMGALVALSAGLGITIPLVTAVGAAFMRTRQAARDAATGVDEFEQSIQSLDASLRDMLRTREAIRLGITPEELLGVQSMGQAAEGLRAARVELERIRAARDALANAPASPEGAIMGLLSRRNAAASAREEAEALGRVIAAENRLTQLREQQGREQFANFADRLRQYQEEIRLNEAIVRFGADSAEVRRIETEQALAAELRRIEALREADDITDAQAAALRRIAQEHSNAAAAAAETADAARGIADEISLAVTQANRLASALDAAAAAGLSRQRQIAVVTAQIAAQRGGLSTAVAEARAGTEFDLSAAGADSIVAGAAGAIAAAEAAQLEQLQNTLRALQDTGSGSSGGGAEQFMSRIFSPDMVARIEQVTEQARLYQQEVRLLDSALQNGLISQQRYNELLNQAQEVYGQAQMAGYDYAAALEEVTRTAESAMERAFMSMIDGSQSVADAFRNMAREIIAEAFRMLVVRPIIDSIFGGGGGGGGGLFGGAGFLGGMFGFANGGAFRGGSVIPFANGGVVGSPTLFPMSGGRTGLMGEAGPEAIMPLKRGRDGRLGVAAEGGGAVTVNLSFNVAANGDESVKRIVAQQVPAITEAAKAGVLDARRRGGAMRRTFS